MVPGLICAGLAPAHANALTIVVWPGNDPRQTVQCPMTLTHARFSTVEMIGHGPAKAAGF